MKWSHLGLSFSCLNDLHTCHKSALNILGRFGKCHDLSLSFLSLEDSAPKRVCSPSYLIMFDIKLSLLLDALSGLGTSVNALALHCLVLFSHLTLPSSTLFLEYKGQV